MLAASLGLDPDRKDAALALGIRVEGGLQSSQGKIHGPLNFNRENGCPACFLGFTG